MEGKQIKAITGQRLATHSMPAFPQEGFLHLLPIAKDLLLAQFFASAVRRKSFPQGIISKFSS